MRARLPLVALLCAVVALTAAWIHDADGPAPQSSPWLNIEVGKSTVVLRGIVSSSAHLAILQQTANRYFVARQAHFDLEVRPSLPPRWALITDLTLRALAQTRSASADITDTGIEVRGIAASAADWEAAAGKIEQNLLPGMSFRHQVTEIAAAGSLQRQCIEIFRTAMRGRKIEFPRSSAEFSTSTKPVLDELIQIAADCPGAKIEIRGHTDSTGDEAANRFLSQARAETVAAYLVAGGIAASRITATGAGSAEPLVEDVSSRARQLNRRIDIELLFP